MEIEWKLEPGREKLKIVVLAGEDNEDLQRLLRELAGLTLDPIPVWEGDRTMALPQGEFLRFYTDGKGVAAQTRTDTYAVRLRLYELEDRLDPHRFVRISNSEIVNLDTVTAIDLSLSGTIRMTLNGSIPAYVSRRYVKKIKETLGLGRGHSK